jgi:hypothetical protein
MPWRTTRRSRPEDGTLKVKSVPRTPQTTDWLRTRKLSSPVRVAAMTRTLPRLTWSEFTFCGSLAARRSILKLVPLPILMTDLLGRRRSSAWVLGPVVTRAPTGMMSPSTIPPFLYSQVVPSWVFTVNSFPSRKTNSAPTWLRDWAGTMAAARARAMIAANERFIAASSVFDRSLKARGHVEGVRDRIVCQIVD